MMPQTRRRVAAAALLTAVITLAALLVVTRWPDTPARALAVRAGTVAAAILATVAALVALTAGARWLGARTLPRLAAAMRARRARRAEKKAAAAERARTPSAGHAPPPPTPGRPRMAQRTARILVGVTAAAVLTVAGVAVALNFAHAMDVAAYNGEGGWRAWLYPLPGDGLLIAASLVALIRRLLLLSVGWRARAAFVLGILASAGTNVLAAIHADLSGWQLAERIVWIAWPTIALLAAHEMLMEMLGHYARTADIFGVAEPDPALIEAERARQDAEDRARQALDAAEQIVADAHTKAAQEIERARADAAAHTEQMLAQAETEHARIQEDAERLRADLAHAQQAHQADAAERARVEDALRAQLADAQRSAADAAEEAEKVRLELDQLDQVDSDRTTEDWRELRDVVHAWIRQCAQAGRTVTAADIMRVYHTSLRWAQARLADTQPNNGHRTNNRQLSFA
ncbi:hypothetical protein GCM10012275_60640 [Longimycelium tulufanense]|uniref:DUF2637 domain-containing protein n=1 Tax=Longimycelium tulufanense TaxID=907463 RepID=A0A8J3CE83_9PSEU|nr:DUF2637 domain-containing protein [Longimycelium tulufanense]GGM81922.1 hypothetical protein GCM10012275_60640 [Longimycelium tulufanense]